VSFDGYFQPQHLTQAFESLARPAGVPTIRFTTSGTPRRALALAAGIHPKIVSERLGHTTVQLTLDCYSHVVDGLQEAAADRLGDVIFRAASSARRVPDRHQPPSFDEMTSHPTAALASGDVTPAEAREEYVNLMRWRLQEVRGYKWTHPLEILNERGHSIYHMIFATDHEAGNRIMTSLYDAAATEVPAMRAEPRRRRCRLAERDAGVFPLFDDEIDSKPVGPREKLYDDSPPRRSYGLPMCEGSPAAHWCDGSATEPSRRSRPAWASR
jgi:hypothetical protein